jgi:hypothetical protein
LSASWQGFVGLGPQRRAAALHFTAEARSDYNFRARDVANPEEKIPAVVLFKLLDSDEGQLLMNQFSYNTSNPKK